MPTHNSSSSREERSRTSVPSLYVMVMGSPMGIYEFLKNEKLDLRQHGLLYADDLLFAGDDALCLVTAATSHHGSQHASVHLLDINLEKAFDALNRNAVNNLKGEQRPSSKMEECD